ncbi:hypothetical protein CPB84DRAFT_1840752 [Gymnopilus junonius]|uniref:Uncharacterized protein n=1 Tax=Gymnopilus junonius TaxID=109634 RepID=A0A9P5NZM4_GYMJU|nr:hypothetical protein CPB84DRAFT_1840752 [Gymnopilus junonius]
MAYRPRFAQPFTLSQAIGLDVGVITEEIARLQNSLKHLKETQTILKSALKEEGQPDPELSKAYEENELVIGSQEERISILKMALTEKGIVAGSPYDPQSAPQTETITNDTSEEGEGVYL